MGQQILPNAEEILAVLAQSLHESFLGYRYPLGSGGFSSVLFFQRWAQLDGHRSILDFSETEIFPNFHFTSVRQNGQPKQPLVR